MKNTVYNDPNNNDLVTYAQDSPNAGDPVLTLDECLHRCHTTAGCVNVAWKHDHTMCKLKSTFNNPTTQADSAINADDGWSSYRKLGHCPDGYSESNPAGSCQLGTAAPTKAPTKAPTDAPTPATPTAAPTQLTDDDYRMCVKTKDEEGNPVEHKTDVETVYVPTFSPSPPYSIWHEDNGNDVETVKTEVVDVGLFTVTNANKNYEQTCTEISQSSPDEYRELTVHECWEHFVLTKTHQPSGINYVAWHTGMYGLPGTWAEHLTFNVNPKYKDPNNIQGHGATSYRYQVAYTNHQNPRPSGHHGCYKKTFAYNGNSADMRIYFEYTATSQPSYAFEGTFQYMCRKNTATSVPAYGPKPGLHEFRTADTGIFANDVVVRTLHDATQTCVSLNGAGNGEYADVKDTLCYDAATKIFSVVSGGSCASGSAISLVQTDDLCSQAYVVTSGTSSSFNTGWYAHNSAYSSKPGCIWDTDADKLLRSGVTPAPTKAPTKAPTLAPTGAPTPYHTSDFRLCVRMTYDGNGIHHQAAAWDPPFTPEYYPFTPGHSSQPTWNIDAGYSGDYDIENHQDCEAASSNQLASLTQAECEAQFNAHFQPLGFTWRLNQNLASGCVAKQSNYHGGQSPFDQVQWNPPGSYASSSTSAGEWFICKSTPSGGATATYQPDEDLHEERTSASGTAFIKEIVIRPLHNASQPCSSLGNEYADITADLCYDESTRIFSLSNGGPCPGDSAITDQQTRDICQDAFVKVYDPPPNSYTLVPSTTDAAHAAHPGCTWDSSAGTLLTSALTFAPTQAPTQDPTQAPTQAPTEAPSQAPTQAPSQAPTQAPTESPTPAPTFTPTGAPTTLAPTFNTMVEYTVTVTGSFPNWQYIFTDTQGNTLTQPSFALYHGTTYKFILQDADGTVFTNHPFSLRIVGETVAYTKGVTYYSISTPLSHADFYGGTHSARSIVFTPDETDATNHVNIEYYCPNHSGMEGLLELRPPKCDVADLNLAPGVSVTCPGNANEVDYGVVCAFSKPFHNSCGSTICTNDNPAAVFNTSTDTCQPNPCPYAEPAFALWPGGLTPTAASAGVCSSGQDVPSGTTCHYELPGHTCTSTYTCQTQSWLGSVTCVPDNCTYAHTLKPEQLHAGSLWHVVGGTNVSTPDDVMSTCDVYIDHHDGIVPHGTDCLHSIAGHHSCTNRTCVNGTMCHLTGDIADCNPSSVGTCEANGCPLADLLWGHAYFQNEWMAMETLTTACQGTGTLNHKHQCTAKLSSATQTYDCHGLIKVCKFGYWEWGNTTVDLQTQCQANPCVYDASTMDVSGATSSCSDGENVQHEGTCTFNRTGHWCPAPLVCWAGTWKIQEYAGTQPVLDLSVTRACTPLACPRSEMTIQADVFGLNGTVANPSQCNFQETFEAGQTIGDAVPSGTACQYDTSRSECVSNRCHQGQWNVSTIVCEEPKGCNPADIALPSDGNTLNTVVAGTCASTNLVTNGTVCPVEDDNDANGDHLCNSVQCHATQWHQVINPVTGIFNLQDQCLDAPCPFAASQIPAGASSSCQGGEEIQSGLTCRFERPGYNCTLTALTCKEGEWQPRPTDTCSELPCPYNASVHLGETSDCTGNLIQAQTVCNHTKSGFSCLSTQCLLGKFQPAQTQCTELPCVFDSSYIPIGAQSPCNHSQVLAHGHQCAITRPGYNCGQDLVCDKGEWRVGGSLLTSSNLPRCDTPACELSNLNTYHGAHTTCAASVYGPVTGPNVLGANYPGSTCNFTLAGHACDSATCSEGSNGNWDVSKIECRADNCLFSELTPPGLGSNTHNKQLQISAGCDTSTNGQTDLASGHSCSYSATGYTCQDTQCINGSWTLDTPQCTPNDCTVQASNVPPGASPMGQCQVGQSVASGAQCQFDYLGHTCTQLTCYAGEFVGTASCAPNPCNHTELEHPARPSTDDALPAEFQRTFVPVPTCNAQTASAAGTTWPLLPSGTSCSFIEANSATTCGTSQCVNGSWTNTPVQCTDPKCDANDPVLYQHKKLAGGSANCSFPSTSVVNGEVPSGTQCQHSRPGWGCGSSYCVRGTFLNTSNLQCSENPCPFSYATMLPDLYHPLLGTTVKPNIECTKGGVAVPVNVNTTIVPAQTECAMSLIGYRCKSSVETGKAKCVAEVWTKGDIANTPADFSCEGLLCKYDNLEKATNGMASTVNATLNATAICSGSVDHGATCAFAKPHHDCETSTCRYGNWTDPSVSCAPRQCYYNASQVLFRPALSSTNCTGHAPSGRRLLSTGRQLLSGHPDHGCWESGGGGIAPEGWPATPAAVTWSSQNGACYGGHACDGPSSCSATCAHWGEDQGTPVTAATYNFESEECNCFVGAVTVGGAPGDVFTYVASSTPNDPSTCMEHPPEESDDEEIELNVCMSETYGDENDGFGGYLRAGPVASPDHSVTNMDGPPWDCINVCADWATDNGQTLGGLQMYTKDAECFCYTRDIRAEASAVLQSDCAGDDACNSAHDYQTFITCAVTGETPGNGGIGGEENAPATDAPTAAPATDAPTAAPATVVHVSHLAPGTTCVHQRYGYDCQDTTCKAEIMDIASPVCTPKKCDPDQLILPTLPTIVPTYPMNKQPTSSCVDPSGQHTMQPNGTVCTFTADQTAQYDCTPTQCLYGNWTRTNITCVPRDCTYDTAAQLGNAQSSSCSDGTHAPGTVCTNSKPGFNCTDIGCIGGVFYDTQSTCAVNPCPYGPTKVPVGAHTNCTSDGRVSSSPSSTVPDKAICAHNRTGYTCSTLRCGYLQAAQLDPSEAVCLPNPCPVSSLSLPTNASSDCDALGSVASGTSCNVTKSGHSCTPGKCMAEAFEQPICTPLPCPSIQDHASTHGLTYNSLVCDNSQATSQEQPHGSSDCRLVRNGYDCAPFACNYGVLSQGQCTPKACPLAFLDDYLGNGDHSPNGASLLNVSQCNIPGVSSAGQTSSTELPHNTQCPIMYRPNTAQKLATDYPRFDCSSVACKFGAWHVQTGASWKELTSQDPIVCTAAPCPYTQPADVLGLGTSTCANQTTVVNEAVCQHTRPLHTCEDLKCLSGYMFLGTQQYDDSLGGVCTVDPTTAPTHAPSQAPTFAVSAEVLVGVTPDANGQNKFDFNLPGFDIDSNIFTVTAKTNYEFKIPESVFQAHPFGLKSVATDPPTEYTNSVSYMVNGVHVSIDQFYDTANFPGDRTLTLSPRQSDVGTTDIVYYCKLHPGMQTQLVFGDTVAPTQAPSGAPTKAPSFAPSQAPTQAPTEDPTRAPTGAPTESPTMAATTPAPTLTVGLQGEYIFRVPVNQTGKTQSQIVESLQQPEVTDALMAQIEESIAGLHNQSWTTKLSIGQITPATSRRLLSVGLAYYNVEVVVAFQQSTTTLSINTNTQSAMNQTLQDLAQLLSNATTSTQRLNEWMDQHAAISNNQDFPVPLLTTTPTLFTITSISVVTVVAPIQTSDALYADVVPETERILIIVMPILVVLLGCCIAVQLRPSDPGLQQTIEQNNAARNALQQVTNFVKSYASRTQFRTNQLAQLQKQQETARLVGDPSPNQIHVKTV